MSDPGAAIIARLGILDATSVAGQPVPYAGSFLLDGEGRIQAKFFEADTEYRRTAASILSLAGRPGGGTAIAAARVNARPWASNQTIAPGQRFTVGVDLELEPGWHAYAPGARGYRGLDLAIDGDPLFEPGELRVPPPRLLFFAPLNETVPVLEGTPRVARDVTQKFRVALKRLRDRPEVKAPVTGMLLYQICSDRVCHPPASMPLRWEVTIRPWTR